VSGRPHRSGQRLDGLVLEEVLQREVEALGFGLSLDLDAEMESPPSSK
jgi:hypothetical protein